MFSSASPFSLAGRFGAQRSFAALSCFWSWGSVLADFIARGFSAGAAALLFLGLMASLAVSALLGSVFWRLSAIFFFRSSASLTSSACSLDEAVGSLGLASSGSGLG